MNSHVARVEPFNFNYPVGGLVQSLASDASHPVTAQQVRSFQTLQLLQVAHRVCYPVRNAYEHSLAYHEVERLVHPNRIVLQRHIEEINHEIVVTNLQMKSFPIIRYKLGDYIELESDLKKCKCGRNLPVIEEIIGRETDTIYTKNNFLIVHFFTILFEYICGVEQFQIKQKKIDEVQVLLKVNSKFTKKDETNIIFKIKEASNNELKIKIKYVDNIPLAKSGKRRFIISEIKK